jgi:hypothetical protein
MDTLKSVVTSIVPPLHIAEKIKPLITKEKFGGQHQVEHENVRHLSTKSSGSVTGIIMSIINIAICFTAFYFVFKCGGHFLDFIAACCCSICYIAYRLAVPCVKPVVQTVRYVQQVPVAAPVA